MRYKLRMGDYLNRIVKKIHYELIICKQKLERNKGTGYAGIHAENIPTLLEGVTIILLPR